MDAKCPWCGGELEEGRYYNMTAGAHFFARGQEKARPADPFQHRSQGWDRHAALCGSAGGRPFVHAGLGLPPV